MFNSPLDIRINAQRFRTDFEALSRIGATPEGGVHRPSLTEAHLEVCAWFRQRILDEFPDCVANDSTLHLTPGAFNIVPGRAELSLEFRSPDSSSYQQLEEALLQLAREITKEYGLGLEVDFLERHHPTPMSPIAQGAIIQAADALDLTHLPLVSGAGHDAQSLAEICPAGMIFVPSESGASHSPREFTIWEDCVNGANVLLGAALRMAGVVSN
jgi:N-carbamoyl-L-amino-acid hydrolase